MSRAHHQILSLHDYEAEALERLSDSTRASGSNWAFGVEVCARALLSKGQSADRPYRKAVYRLGRARLA